MKFFTIAVLAIAPMLAMAAASPKDVAFRDAIDTYNHMIKREADNIAMAPADSPLEKRKCKNPKSLCYPDGFSSCYSNCFNPACTGCSIGCSISCADMCNDGSC